MCAAASKRHKDFVVNYLIKERLDALACAFVLGTLSPRAARRFQSVMAHSREARVAVDAWQELLHKLSVATPRVEPSAKVWSRITARIEGRASSLRGWGHRWLPGLGAAFGLVMGLGLARLDPSWVGVTPTSKVALAPSYVGILTTPSNQPVVVLSSLRFGRELTAKILRPLSVPEGQVARVWALSDGTAPVALGVLPPSGKAVIILPDTSEKMFSRVSRLAVTFEAVSAVSATATPVGDFVLSGNCVKLW